MFTNRHIGWLHILLYIFCILLKVTLYCLSGIFLGLVLNKPKLPPKCRLTSTNTALFFYFNLQNVKMKQKVWNRLVGPIILVVWLYRSNRPIIVVFCVCCGVSFYYAFVSFLNCLITVENVSFVNIFIIQLNRSHLF